jgi:hypothetical protein
MFWQSSKEDLLLTKSVVGGSGPITDMVGIWNALKDDHMTAHDRLIVLYEVNRRPTRVYQNTTGCAK